MEIALIIYLSLALINTWIAPSVLERPDGFKVAASGVAGGRLHPVAVGKKCICFSEERLQFK